MKKTNTILTLLIWGLFFSLTARAQLHIAGGTADLEEDGPILAWNVGYTHFTKKFGFGINYRLTHSSVVNHYTLEALTKYRIGNKKYRLDLGGGYGWKHETGEFNPLMQIRNTFNVNGVWMGIDVDKVFSGRETYYLFVVNIPFLKNDNKPRFF